MIKSAMAGIVAFAALLAFATPVLAADSMPANIQAIMKKVQQGQVPSPADQKTLMDWASGRAKPAAAPAGSGGGGEFSSTMDHETSSDEDDANARNLCKTNGKAGFGAAPSQDAYVAMAKSATQEYSAKLPDGALFLLKRQLDAATNPTWGADASLLMLAKSSGSAAIVAAASSAQRSPRDALTASNLGVALRGMKDYARATIALTYAKALSPDSTVVATNLGWLAMSRHDALTAGAFFNAALTKNKQMSAALAGDGLIAQCAGKHSQAMKYFRASLQNGYSKLAQVGLQSAIADIQKAGGNGADIGKPEDDGPPSKDIPTPQWPDANIAGSAMEFVAWSQAHENNVVRKAQQGWEDAITQTGQTIARIGIKADAGAGRTVRGGHTEYRRGYAAEMARIGDLKAMLSVRAEKVLMTITKDEADFRDRDGCLSCAGERQSDPPCSVTRPRVIGLYPAYAGTLRADWTELRRLNGDYYKYVGAAVAAIHDANLEQSEQAQLDQEVATHFAAYYQSMVLGQAEAAIAFQPGQTCGEVPPTPIKPGTLKPYKIDPNACKSGETHMNFGLVNFNADCEKMTLDFGEALVGSGEYKFGNDWGNDQITIFAGVGVSGGLGPLSAGAKTGAFMTFQGGQVMDYGNQSSAGISVGSGPISAGSEMSARISAVSGVDVALDSGVHLGGVNPE